MPSKHKNARLFLRQEFFKGLKSFKDFEEKTKTLSNTTEVGDAFEILVEAYLYLNPVLRAKNVYLVGSVPAKIREELNLPDGTKGIDGVYEDKSGELIPYQVKYRTDYDTLPSAEVDSFFASTEKSLKDRVIFTNARNFSKDIVSRTGMRGIRASQFY